MRSVVKYLKREFFKLPAYIVADALYDSVTESIKNSRLGAYSVLHDPRAIEYGYPTFFKMVLASGLLGTDFLFSWFSHTIPCSVLIMLLQSFDFSKISFHKEYHTDFLLHLVVRDVIPFASFIGMNVAVSGSGAALPSAVIYTLVSKVQQVIAKLYEEYTDNELPAWLNYGGMMHILYPLVILAVSWKLGLGEADSTAESTFVMDFSDADNCVNNPDIVEKALEYLELPLTTSWQTIKEQYKQLARDQHVGNQGIPKNMDIFKQINDAYECLEKVKARF